MLIYAIILISSALVFYTLGVFSEKTKGCLTKTHIVFFIIGLICDTSGTLLMGQINLEPMTISVHSITGLVAVSLMLIHTIWAIYTLEKGSDKQKSNFHKFSLLVWLLWLIPYFSGMFFCNGINHKHLFIEV